MHVVVRVVLHVGRWRNWRSLVYLNAQVRVPAANLEHFLISPASCTYSPYSLQYFLLLFLFSSQW